MVPRSSTIPRLPIFAIQLTGVHRLLGASYLIQERYQDALEAYQRSVDLGGGQIALSVLGSCYGYLGKREEALAILNQFLEMRNQRYVPAPHIARIYLAMGENDLGFEWLERGFEQRDGEMAFFGILSEKIYRRGTFQKDPRLADLLRRMGLPSNQEAGAALSTDYAD